MKKLVVSALLAATHVAHAQLVHGVLLSAADAQPLAYATVAVDDATAGRFTDPGGQFLIRSGSHRIRAEALGFLPLDTTVADAGASSRIVLRLRPLTVSAASPDASLRRCTAPGLSDDPTKEPVLALLRQNVDRYVILVDQYPFRYRWAAKSYLRSTTSARGTANALTGYSPGTDSTVAIDTSSFDSNDRQPYAVGSVVVRHGSKPEMALPTLRDLADPAFTAAHCFAYVATTRGEMRIDFRPAESIHVPDVAGSVYLDAARYVVRRVEFDLTHAEAVNPALSTLSVTTTFREIAPLVAIVDTSETVQNVHPGYQSWTPSAANHGAATHFIQYGHPDEDHSLIDEGWMLSRTFAGDTLGSVPSFGVPRAVAQNARVSISVACELPPSFETADVQIYGTLVGPGAAAPAAMAALTALRPMFHMPNDLTLSVYLPSTGHKVAQTLDGQVGFTLDASGHVTELVTTATSLSTGVDTALVAAVRDAGAAGVFAHMHAGRYTLSISAASPPPGSRSTVFARIESSVLPLARAAALDADSTQPLMAVGGPFQFVVDEHGRPMPTTFRPLASSPDAVVAAAMHALPGLRFKPALVGECPIKQQVTMTGATSHGG